MGLFKQESNMSQHPSFKGNSHLSKHRSVLKRGERIKTLKKDGKWEEKDSVFSLPKVKVMKFKVKKEKAEAKEGADKDAPTADSAVAQAEDPKAKKEEKKDKKSK